MRTKKQYVDAMQEALPDLTKKQINQFLRAQMVMMF